MDTQRKSKTVDYQEYVEDISKSSIESSDEYNSPIFLNHSKELEFFKVVDQQDSITNDQIPERRLELATTIKKVIGTGLHTFTLNEVKVLA